MHHDGITYSRVQGDSPYIGARCTWGPGGMGGWDPECREILHILGLAVLGVHGAQGLGGGFQRLGLFARWMVLAVGM